VFRGPKFGPLLTETVSPKVGRRVAVETAKPKVGSLVHVASRSESGTSNYQKYTRPTVGPKTLSLNLSV